MQDDISGTSYYYHEPFTSVASASNNGWNFSRYNLGRDGILNAPDEPRLWTDINNLATNDISGGQFRIYGRPNNCILAYNNYWVGRAVQFIPLSNATFGANFSASATQPIGFSIIRHHANIDVNMDIQGDTEYHQASLNIWLAQEDLSVTNELDNLANFAYFMELAKENSVAGDVSRLGYFGGAEVFPATATGPTNASYAGFATGTWRIDYDNVNAQGTLNGIRNSSDSPNLNPLGIRMTHDGSTIRFYLNPNPISGDGRLDGEPNEYFYFGSVSVGWNTDMKVMLGHESLYFANETQDGIYDDFLVRTVCNTLTASISPQQVLAGANTTFKVVAVPTISANDSGIGEITIKKPSYITNEWQLSTVIVSNSSSGTFNQLTRLTTGIPATTSQFRVLTNSDGDLKVIF